jgi:hypothetical protein
LHPQAISTNQQSRILGLVHGQVHQLRALGENLSFLSRSTKNPDILLISNYSMTVHANDTLSQLIFTYFSGCFELDT